MQTWEKSKFIKFCKIILCCFVLYGITLNASQNISLAENKRLINTPNTKIETRYKSNATSRDYLLGVNDIISIFVYDASEFKQEKIRIQPDGNIIVSPLGRIHVADKTIEELHSILVEKYKFYLKDPQVTIRLDNTRPFLAYIAGAVMNPGTYELNTDTTANRNFNAPKANSRQEERKAPLLSNLLIAAGGIQFYADLEHLKITNSKNNTEIEVNLLQLIEKGDLTQDIFLMEGDVIHVPALPTPLAVDEQKYKKYICSVYSPRYIPIKVFGYVTNPGLVKLDRGTSITLNSAIMAAGGYLTDAAYAPKKVMVSRPDISGKLVTKEVNPMSNDIVVMPNDIIFVPEKPRPLIARAFEAVTKILTPINLMANTYNNWALTRDPTRYQVIGK